MKKRGQVFTLPSSSFRTRFRKRASLMSRMATAATRRLTVVYPTPIWRAIAVSPNPASRPARTTPPVALHQVP